MKTISRQVLDKSCAYLEQHCRPLEQKRFAYLFNDGSAGEVLDCLQQYQNDDGGFGNGLEPDFLLPDSSPLATTIAFQIFQKIALTELRAPVKRAVRYLEQQYNPQRQGWYTVPETVNAYPHAPWWHYDAKLGGTVIDQHWGNPSAEIIGYLYACVHGSSSLPLDELLAYAVDHLNKLDAFASEHEIFCYLRLYELLPESQRAALVPQLESAMEQLISTDPLEWSNYVAKAIDFIKTPHSPFYSLFPVETKRNLDYLVDTISDDGVWLPNWSWGQYEEAWQVAQKHWTGIVTINNLSILHQFGRVKV